MMRILWTCLMALLALAAIGAQLDRAAERNSVPFAIVPGPFRHFALEKLVISKVRSAPAPEALATAKKLVQRRPIPSEHLSLLAIATVRDGKIDEAGQLIQMASRRGWRDSLAQQAKFAMAMTAKDPVEASHRLAALWALAGGREPAKEYTAQLLSTPEGRKAMAETLAAGGVWSRAFLASGATAAPSSVAQTMALAAQNGHRFDCDAIKRMQSYFSARKLNDETKLVEQAVSQCVSRKERR